MNRTITVVDTAKSLRRVLPNVANIKTLNDLKKLFTDNGISYEGMEFLEGITKTTFTSDDSVLPTNVEYKGRTTSDLVILLSRVNKRPTLGLKLENRADAYKVIKSDSELKEELKMELGNYTQVKTSVLIEFIEEYYGSNSPKEEDFDDIDDDDDDYYDDEDEDTVTKKLIEDEHPTAIDEDKDYSTDDMIEEIYDHLANIKESINHTEFYLKKIKLNNHLSDKKFREDLENSGSTLTGDDIDDIISANNL